MQAARKEIDVERESQDALAQAEELRHAALEREQQLITEVVQTKLERDSLFQHLEAAQSRADELHTSSGTSNHALQQKQAEIQSVRETNRLLDGNLQQLQSQLHEQVATTKQARATVIELTKARGDLDMKRMHAENELRQCQHAQQTLEVEKDLLQKDVASLQTQLANKSESLRQSWADANAKAHELEQQLQGAQSQQLALSASNKQFEQNRDRLIEQLQTAEKERQDAQSQLQEQKTTFEEELASLHTLASRHKEERLALEHDKQALAGLVQELTRKAEAFKADQQQVSAQLQQRLDTAEQACQERDQTIERFKHAMEDTGNPALLRDSSNAATALPAQGQQSPVQVYSQYVDLVHKYDKLKEEHSRLQADWLQFEHNVIPEAQKAQQLAKRNVDLDEANAKLSAQVQVANEKAKRCIDATYKWQGQFDDEKSAHGVARKLLKEAQHQVVLLANENRQLNGVRERAVMPAWSNAILAANLVEFKDTQELVAKNEALRRLAHELQLKAEQQLKQKDSDAHGREQQIMKSYEDSLAAARQQNAVAMEQMQHLMRQRDSAQQAAKTAVERQTAASDAQQGGSGQSERSSELEKELSKLREDGHAYREELRQH
ncbi:MAG: hypothetical protein FRX49_13228 [Trebouxia sp. A1-2]|nr:MAG: hypothetical protein FRX49_13228 [Trebouxia sp. A1-2]